MFELETIFLWIAFFFYIFLPTGLRIFGWWNLTIFVIIHQWSTSFTTFHTKRSIVFFDWKHLIFFHHRYSQSIIFRIFFTKSMSFLELALSSFVIFSANLLKLVIEYFNKNHISFIKDRVNLAPSVYLIESIFADKSINGKSITQSRTNCMIIYFFLKILCSLYIIVLKQYISHDHT